MRLPVGQIALGLLLASTVSQACLAQSATPGSAIQLDPIVVEGSRDGVPAFVRERFFATAGGATLLTTEALSLTGNPTMAKALRDAPGVVVQEFFGGNDQPRIQIRGSGLQQNPVERGILMLRDGLPLNRADGSYIVGLANPAQAQSIEVYRGQTSHRLGATVLGGALNFVSPTGNSAPGSQVAVSGGSFGQLDVSGRTGFNRDGVDGMLQADISRRDGYRVYNESQRVNVGANVGVALTDSIKTRFFVGYTDLGFDVAGPLTKQALRADPRQIHGGPRVVGGTAIGPGPNVPRDRPRRETQQFFIGNRTTAEFGPHLFDLGLGYTYTDDMFRFPIASGVRVTKGGDFTAVGRYAYKPDQSAALPLFETTAQYVVGSAKRENYLNQGGVQGALFGESDLDASTLSLYAGANIPVWQGVTISPALSYSYATRDNTDTYALARRPTVAYSPASPYTLLPNGSVPTQKSSYARSYDGWSPSLSVSYRPDANQMFFAALSRSFEPPTHDDLLATVNGTPNSSAGRPNPAAPMMAAAAFTTPALKAQTATTLEGGWRGRHGDFSWDGVAYYSWVDKELLSLRDASGTSLGAINADKTTHFGIELGLGARLLERLTGRLAYTYQDFRFDNDPVRGNNRLAGAPRHLVNATLQFQATEAWMLQASLRWNPEKTPVDNMNTLYADPYALLDLRTEYRINESFTVFGEVSNLFDKTYASSTLVVDQARADQAAFQPGTGRAVFGGVRARF
ncbi:ligand-gated channel [Bosea sp. Root381]|uniref:TonB-dependent receptor family protein n=1 Tax=Bosea sp. Root381 TaxID=1736524 RepID=UPI0006FED29B|nr:TonB-dependent receptor [Bosea sp. Root381]KRD95874.1 ligand-gated channel [Bosea sp. Root381]